MTVIITVIIILGALAGTPRGRALVTETSDAITAAVAGVASHSGDIPTPLTQAVRGGGAAAATTACPAQMWAPRRQMINLKVEADLRSVATSGTPVVSRLTCPPTPSTSTTARKADTIVIDVITLQVTDPHIQQHSSGGSAATALPALTDLFDATLSCTFDSGTRPWPTKTTAVIPRTSCSNVECACQTASSEWTTFATHPGDSSSSSSRFTAAFSLSETSNGMALVIFELAMIVDPSAVPAAAATATSGITERELANLPKICHLYWTT